MNFEQAAKKVIDFAFQMTGSTAKLHKLEKSSEGWQGFAEVYEESAFIKSIGLPSKVMDRNIYEIRLNNALEVISFAKQNENSIS